MWRRIAYFRVIVCFASALLISAQSSTQLILPVDEASRDPELLLVRQELVTAAGDRDLHTVRNLAAANVMGCGWKGRN